MAAVVQNLPADLQSLSGNGLGLADAAGIAAALSGLSGASSQNAVTASTTQTQVGATALTAAISAVNTVTNASDAVKMPQALPGKYIFIANNGGNVMSLFPFLGDTINDAAANASVSVADNTLSVYVCAVAGLWVGGALTFET